MKRPTSSAIISLTMTTKPQNRSNRSSRNGGAGLAMMAGHESGGEFGQSGSCASIHDSRW
jgi:hypothetical protein